MNRHKQTMIIKLKYNYNASIKHNHNRENILIIQKKTLYNRLNSSYNNKKQLTDKFTLCKNIQLHRQFNHFTNLLTYNHIKIQMQ